MTRGDESGKVGALPLSAAQEGIWVGQSLDPGNPAYNTAEFVSINGQVDLSALTAAVQTAVGETDVMHARFTVEDGRIHQYLDQQSDCHLPVIDLRDGGEQEAWKWARQDVDRVTDLGRGPLFTQALLRVADDQLWWYQKVHHIAMDGFGYSLLGRRVAQLYTACMQGATPPERAFGAWADVVAADEEYRASPRWREDRDFWYSRFVDGKFGVGLDGSAERASEAGVAYRSLRHEQILGAGLTDRLRSLATAVKLTWVELVLAAAGAYVCRWTGSEEIVLGMPVMGRLDRVTMRVPGMVMNTVPVRLVVDAQDTLLTLAMKVATELREIRPHQRYRHEELRRDLGLAGSGKRIFGPAVNVMPFGGVLDFAGVPAATRPVSAGPVDDVTIGFRSVAGGGIRLEFEGNPTYGDDVLADHCSRFTALLDAYINAPDKPVRRLLTRAIPSAVLEGGPLPSPRPVLDVIRSVAEGQPGAVAIQDGDRCLDYAELLRAAEDLADRLIAAKVVPGDLVPVLLPRGADAVIAILGVLLAGGAYVPLDPAGPAGYTAEVLRDMTVLVTTSTHNPVPPAMGPGLILLDQLGGPRPRHARLLPNVDEALAAYVMHSSGSSGTPRGIVVGRSALAAFVAGAQQIYGLRGSDRVLQFAPLHFDTSVEEIFLTLCQGATLVVRDERMLDSLSRFVTECARLRVTVLDLPTAFWHELVYALDTGQCTLPETVRMVVIGGEEALVERVRRWRHAVGPEVRLLNTYGPTEATVVATATELSEEDPVPIGTPLPGVRAAVIGSGGLPVPPGVRGELCLAGPGLAIGYLGDPDRTAEKFVRLPGLSYAPRWLRTGDLAVLRTDGRLGYIGRIDDEFKISGHRLDPAGVETLLVAHSGVREAVVVGVDLPGGVKRVSATVVAARPDHPPSRTELLDHLGAVLPGALLPSTIEFVDALPRTVSGKTDRNALRASVRPTPSSPNGLVEVVTAVWEEVLGARPEKDDDFFSVGGHSLQAVQMANRLSARLGREVGAATLLQYTSPEGLALALASHETDRPDTSRMTTDTALGALLPNRTAQVRNPGPPSTVLLTGATGFVGAHLLAHLLAEPDIQVLCLVRADSPEHASQRVHASLTLWGMPTDFGSRVTAIPADLARPGLGLSPEQHVLLTRCDSIVHVAAEVGLARDYDTLRGVNVLGTLAVLQLAMDGSPTPVHHVSTLAVAHDLEEFSPLHPGLRDGYQQTKWVAEDLVRQAHERGLPVTVYRLSRVLGTPGVGPFNEGEYLWRILLSGIRAGALPDLGHSEAWTPVEHVASVVAGAVSRGERGGGVQHIALSAPVRWADIVDWVADYGYPVRKIPVKRWLARMTAANDPAAALPLESLKASPDVERSSEVLAEYRALLHHHLDHCVTIGLLPAPERNHCAHAPGNLSTALMSPADTLDAATDILVTRTTDIH